jgi:hypothetical protein
MQLSIDADDIIERHSGTEIAVWNPATTPGFGISCPLPGISGGIKWELRADTDGDGDFTDAGSAIVQYNLFDGLDALLMDFGNGGLVTIATLGGATVTPAAPLGGYAWRDVSVVGPAADGTDNTNTVGIYKFASCGTEGTTLTSNYVGTTTFQIVGGMIEWEKRLQSTTTTPHPLQGGATFRVTPDPFDADPFLLVTDNVAPDVDVDAGQIKLNSTEAGTFTITEETAPAGCTKDAGARVVTISQGSLNQVIGTQGTDDDGGDVNERDFHNDCRGMIEWEKRLQNNGPPHPLQGGATFRITPNPFTGAGSLDVADNGVNDLDADAGQIKVNNTFIGAYTIREITPPAGHTVDPDTRSVTVTLADRNQVIGSPLGAPPGTDDDSPGNVNERDFHDSVFGKIIIIKDTVPNGPQDFKFTHNITSTPAILSPFFLDDDSSPPLSNTQTFDKVPPGSYTVTEMTVPAIPLQTIRCVDPDGGSVRAGNSANIDMDAGETITCTFVNGVQEAPCGNGQLPTQPEDTISMTTIRNNNIVKTIHAEKQIFNCELPQGDIPVIADVTIIAEIFEDINTKTVIGKQVEVVTCIKMNATATILECSLSIPSQDRTPVANCSESPIEHPQEMNTISKGATAKTIETQKEVFICTFADGTDPPESTNPNDKKVDLVLFTEIYENLNTQTSEDPQILSMKCVIKIDNVKVESCRFTNHPL